MMAVEKVVIQVCLHCLVKLKMKIYHLTFNDGRRECGHSGKSEVYGEYGNESVAFRVK